MPKTLSDWLAYLTAQHPRGEAGIELGLDRVAAVKNMLGQRQTVPVVTVAGTNGKGSTCAMLEQILLSAGYRVGLYTSPHLLRYNERVRINGQPVDDALLCAAFARVEPACGDLALTYFEFGTLAAWEAFAAQELDVVILEVGLGGRLDAVNVYDAECAILTTVDLDHTEYLGEDRVAIGREKAGIFRPGRAAICGDAEPPQSVLDHAQSIAADLQILGRDFTIQRQEGQWQFLGRGGRRSGLAYPALRGSSQLVNASCVLAALDALHGVLPVAMQDIRRGLLEVDLPGRFQVLPGRPTVVLDVAHNPQAARVLADNLGNMPFHPNTWAVFGMMADKDISGVIDALRGRVDRWLPCTLPAPRGASAEQLAQLLGAVGINGASTFASPALAFAAARERAGEDDRILAFGSFLTVADVMHTLARLA
jgi:dihydrofolate synthase/folylpolyglutamate synthase